MYKELAFNTVLFLQKKQMINNEVHSVQQFDLVLALF